MAVALTPQPPLPIPANGFTALTDQLPEDWKKPVAELVASAAVMYRHVKDYNHTIENINHLEGFVNAKTVPDRSTVQTFLDKVKNFKDDFKKNYLDLVCKDGSCEKSFDEIWESARGEVMDQLKKEKQEAANNCVKTQAIVSAVVLVIEFNAVYSVWGNIENAENVTRECRERDIPEIRRRMNHDS